MRRKEKNIHDEIKDKFGTNKVHDEKFSKKTYLDSLVTNAEGEAYEFPQANPDQLDSEDTPYSKKLNEEADFKIEVIQEVMGTLSEKQRQVIELLADGLSWEEASKKLNISKSMVQTHLTRARAKIKKAYDMRKGD